MEHFVKFKKRDIEDIVGNLVSYDYRYFYFLQIKHAN